MSIYVKELNEFKDGLFVLISDAAYADMTDMETDDRNSTFIYWHALGKEEYLKSQY